MLETENLFKSRVNYAYRYFNFLAKSKGEHWIEILGQVETDETLGIPEVLALLLPEHYLELGIQDPRGPRSFEGATAYSKCRSKEIWGYQCPFEGAKVHVDHLFPQSRGGLTHHTNAMHLCEFHNTAKFTDIHLIPWERMPENNEWIVIALNRMLEGARRLTKKKLYLPVKQLSNLN